MRLILALIMTTLLAATPYQTAPVQVLEMWVDYRFGDEVLFQARVKSDLPVQAAITFFQSQADAHTQIGMASITKMESGELLLAYTHQSSEYTIPAFSQIDYRFEIMLEGGRVFRTPTASFAYTDNRFEWRDLEEGSIRVHWVEGDVQFAQMVVDVAQKGKSNVQNLLPLPAPGQLDIYVYPDAASLQAALHPAASDWVAGHADPTLGVILVTLPSGPEQRLITEQRIPHELMHIMLYQATNLGYSNVPTWLNEGLATQAELYPNPDYRIILEDTVDKGGLIPMGSICEGFPREASNALLSYAQSASFTNYLYRAYGTTGLQNLVTAYANGLDCQRGAQAALGKDLNQLERAWQRNDLSQNVASTALNNLLPWLVLLGLLMLGPLMLLGRRLTGRTASQQTQPR